MRLTEEERRRLKIAHSGLTDTALDAIERTVVEKWADWLELEKDHNPQEGIGIIDLSLHSAAEKMRASLEEK